MVKAASAKTWRLVISCEHASWHIPAGFLDQLSRKDRKEIKTHRGWDIGALQVAKYLARRFKVPCFSSKISRLLVDCNRSVHHAACLGASFRGMPKVERNFILTRYYWPYRNEVEHEIRRLIKEGHRVLHIAVHSFTPVLAGEKRKLDFALLYDPGRSLEKIWSNHILSALVDLDPELILRRNYPYRGTADGFTTWLRRQYQDPVYAGLEVEINQTLFAEEGGSNGIEQSLAKAILIALKSDI